MHGVYLCKLGVGVVRYGGSDEVSVLGPGGGEELLERPAASNGVKHILNLYVVHQLIERSVHSQNFSHYNTKTEGDRGDRSKILFDRNNYSDRAINNT